MLFFSNINIYINYIEKLVELFDTQLYVYHEYDVIQVSNAHVCRIPPIQLWEQATMMI